MLIFRPRASRMAPNEADAMPLPSEETTPPVTKTNRVMMGHRRLNIATSEPNCGNSRGQTSQLRINGNSTGIQATTSGIARQYRALPIGACGHVEYSDR